jgi:hypothetical protein
VNPARHTSRRDYTRDGVIVIDVPYQQEGDTFHLAPATAERLYLLVEEGRDLRELHNAELVKVHYDRPEHWAICPAFRYVKVRMENAYGAVQSSTPV